MENLLTTNQLIEWMEELDCPYPELELGYWTMVKEYARALRLTLYVEMFIANEDHPVFFEGWSVVGTYISDGAISIPINSLDQLTIEELLKKFGILKPSQSFLDKIGLQR